MKRRIAQGVVLLFCSSLGFGQVKVERSIFRISGPDDKIPSFISKPKISSGAKIGFCPNAEGMFLRKSSASNDWWERLNFSKDTAGVETSAVRNDTGSTKKSPGLAMLLSMVIPGSGQVYVHRYITIPIIWGFGYYFAQAWYHQNNQYIKYRELFTASVQADSLHKGQGVYQTYRDFYRDDRDKFAFYLAITYILNIVDAYVGASLYSFDVSDNLGGSAAIRFHIPIR